jgi:hypothetical protein
MNTGHSITGQIGLQQLNAYAIEYPAKLHHFDRVIQWLKQDGRQNGTNHSITGPFDILLNTGLVQYLDVHCIKTKRPQFSILLVPYFCHDQNIRNIVLLSYGI